MKFRSLVLALTLSGSAVLLMTSAAFADWPGTPGAGSTVPPPQPAAANSSVNSQPNTGAPCNSPTVADADGDCTAPAGGPYANGDPVAPPGCPTGQNRDADGDCTTTGGASTAATTTSTTTGTSGTTAAGTTGMTTGTNAAGTTGSSSASGAALANTGTPVFPLALGLILLALGGLVLVRGRQQTA